jgi:RNA polymerase sigma-70 factor (ECF subfamily)
VSTQAHGAPADAIAAAVAAERAAIMASLIRLTGDWTLAEDCVQDAIERALLQWPREGMPRSPAAWLTTVARHRALDVLRRRQNERTKLQQLAIMQEPDATLRPHDPMSDDRLRLIFTCCHPAIALDNRVALTLKTVAGLSTAQIARACSCPSRRCRSGCCAPSRRSLTRLSPIGCLRTNYSPNAPAACSPCCI